MRILPLLALTAVLAAGDGPVRIFMYSECIDPSLADAFEAKTGYSRDIQVYEAQEEMIAKLQTGGTDQYDVLVASGVVVKQMIGLEADPAARPGADPEHNQCRQEVPQPRLRSRQPVQLSLFFWGTSGLMYDPAKVPGEPTWVWVFDPTTAPGPFTLLDEAKTTIANALVYQGKARNSRVATAVKAASQRIATAKASPKCLGFVGGVDGKNRVVAGEVVWRRSTMATPPAASTRSMTASWSMPCPSPRRAPRSVSIC